jgi:hypothetical protein
MLCNCFPRLLATIPCFASLYKQPDVMGVEFVVLDNCAEPGSRIGAQVFRGLNFFLR